MERRHVTGHHKLLALPEKNVTSRELGVDSFAAAAKPQTKVEHLETLAGDEMRVAMTGDGINDAPTHATGYASMAPTAASDVGRAAADFVFLGDRLHSVTLAISVAKSARRLIMQNFGLALVYNLIAVPVAVLGLASPLVAAIAMSVSSQAVTANALRLRLLVPALREHEPVPSETTRTETVPAGASTRRAA